MTDEERTLPSVEQLTGYEMQAMKKAIGRPFLAALDDTDEAAFYAFVWIGEKRSNPTLTFDEVMKRPFGEVMEAFTEAEADPTSAGSGES